MNVPDPDATRLSQLLLDMEAGGNGRCAPIEAVQAVVKKLSQQLALLFGDGGVEAVWHRALALTQPSYPFLAMVKAQRNASEPLLGLDQSIQAVDQQEARSGAQSLIANFLGLLYTLIGKSLTDRQLQHIWPEIENISGNDFTNGDSR
jgi:hypothetical protein